jgi:hypothetical protein
MASICDSIDARFAAGIDFEEGDFEEGFLEEGVLSFLVDFGFCMGASIWIPNLA